MDTWSRISLCDVLHLWRLRSWMEDVLHDHHRLDLWRSANVFPLSPAGGCSSGGGKAFSFIPVVQHSRVHSSSSLCGTLSWQHGPNIHFQTWLKATLLLIWRWSWLMGLSLLIPKLQLHLFYKCDILTALQHNWVHIEQDFTLFFIYSCPFESAEALSMQPELTCEIQKTSSPSFIFS